MGDYARQFALVRRVLPTIRSIHEYEMAFVDRWLAERTLDEVPLVLDAGCGVEYGLLRYCGGRFRSLGVDCDLAALRANRDVQARVAADTHRLPIADERLDLIFCRHVVEHLTDPGATFREFARVLKPGGGIVITTVNVRNPGMWCARLVPQRFRTVIRSRSFGARGENAPTYYRANTPARLRRLIEVAGLTVDAEIYWPSFLWYFRFWTPILILFATLDRLLEILRLTRLHSGLTVGVRKPDNPARKSGNTAGAHAATPKAIAGS